MGKAVTQPLTVQALAAAIGAEVRGDAAALIQSVAPLESAAEGDLAFFTDSKFKSRLTDCKAAALILREVDAGIAGCPCIIHASPHLAFAQALELLFPSPAFVAMVSSNAVVDAGADVFGARILALATVGAGTRVGAGTVVHAGASVGAHVSIGADCVIHAGARIYDGVRLGDRCIVHSGAVIGADGFGFQPTPKGWRKVPQVGGVVIGNDVEVGANTTIDRGAIDDTVLGDGVKLDNLVQIGHNCRIGAHTAIAGCVGIAGSTSIGARCMIGGAAMISGHLAICDDVIVSGGTLVANSIDHPGRYTGVFPTTDHRSWTRIAAGLRRSARQ